SDRGAGPGGQAGCPSAAGRSSAASTGVPAWAMTDTSAAGPSGRAVAFPSKITSSTIATITPSTSAEPAPSPIAIMVLRSRGGRPPVVPPVVVVVPAKVWGEVPGPGWPGRVPGPPAPGP